MWHWLPIVPLVLTLIPAVFGGFIGTKFTLGFLGWFITHMNQSVNFEEEYLIGSQAEVTVPIQGTRLGEITYAVAGRRYNASARAANPDAHFKGGAQVVIADIVDDVIVVEPFLDELGKFDAQLDQKITLATAEPAKDTEKNT
jgi:hypothetical protein